MKIILIRHGQAAPYCADDKGRDLTDFGQNQASQTAAYLQNHQPDLIIASPYNRAYQTAQIILHSMADAHKEPKFILDSSITPDDDPKLAIKKIDEILSVEFGESQEQKTVAIVCHMPIVARLAHLLGADDAGFMLAECRIYDTPVFGEMLATQTHQFIPKQP